MASGDLYLRSYTDKSSDLLRLRADSDKGYVGPTPGWNKVAFTSEPPTPNAWNQIKQDAGTGFKQIKYEGE